MMKPRTSRVINEQSAATTRIKVDPTVAAQANNAQTSAQAIRKRRSSINVYDQPSSLNSRLRQLETDMLRLDEDRSKLYDDTHSALAQYELKLNEIHAILRSRQDNLDKYGEDMKMLLEAKESFEKQAKLLNEKHERVYEKFMHRETTIARDIKLLKNKFELLEKNRQFRTILNPKSSQRGKLTSGEGAGGESNGAGGSQAGDGSQRSHSEAGSGDEAEKVAQQAGQAGSLAYGSESRGLLARFRCKIRAMNPLARIMSPVLSKLGARRKSNRVSSSVCLESGLEQAVTDRSLEGATLG